MIQSCADIETETTGKATVSMRLEQDRSSHRSSFRGITPEEAKIIFGRTWRSKLGKQEWEFYYVVRYIEIDFEFDYNNRCRKK